MKHILFFIYITFFIACQVECPETCLTTEVNQTTTFEIAEEIDPSLYYYLSFKNEDQGIINVQFPATNKIEYPYEFDCQVCYLFVFNTNNSLTVHNSIQNFYAEIDTSMVYFCGDLVGCM